MSELPGVGWTLHADRRPLPRHVDRSYTPFCAKATSDGARRWRTAAGLRTGLPSRADEHELAIGMVECHARAPSRAPDAKAQVEITDLVDFAAVHRNTQVLCPQEHAEVGNKRASRDRDHGALRIVSQLRELHRTIHEVRRPD